ncbi:MAG: hypothetical protein KDA33_06525, partial [Phycisphaerales bacterium]|nr:hypothetical protein [Phycisphaerales bacterium]
YGVSDLETAASMYMSRHVLPYLIPYDEKEFGPYPELVRDLMAREPHYRVESQNETVTRRCVAATNAPARSAEPVEPRRANASGSAI